MLLSGVCAQETATRTNAPINDNDVVIHCDLDPIEAANRYLKLMNEQWNRMLQQFPEYFTSVIKLQPEVLKMCADLDKNVKDKNNITSEELKTLIKQMVDFVKPLWLKLFKGCILSPKQSLDMATYMVIMSTVDKDININLPISLLDACVDFAPMMLTLKTEAQKIQIETSAQMPTEEFAKFLIRILTLVSEQIKATWAQVIQKNIIEPTLAARQMQKLIISSTRA